MAKDKPIKINDKDEPQKTYVHIILDKSGSMSIIRSETVTHFNEQVQELQKKTTEGMDTLVSLTVFDSSVDHKFLRKPVKNLKELALDEYQPCGTTALYDAIGFSLDDLSLAKDIKDENVAVLVVVLSDGAENSSTTYRQAAIAGRIKELRATGRYTFVYIGANQNLEEVSKRLSIPKTNMLRFASSASGVRGMSAAHVGSVGTYMISRSKGVLATHDFYSPDDQAKADLVPESKSSDPSPDAVKITSTTGSDPDGK